MNSSLVFLFGAVIMAGLGSTLVWLLSRPRKQSIDPDEFRRTLRSLNSDQHPGSHSSSAVRMIRDDESGKTGGSA
ncbi:MAG TPA: hypothetical protein QF905_04220 [Acidimicrobiales bacterium]|jgi:hypothetical protein|nr:hypothetical protein [Actinomycetota bacterium]MDP6061780.1 hypothetical protein [Acidimicrobiales bacterium]MDP7208831.1 hypothetical protein [Acidimicrobiales bacterium]HJL89522.1 hypothetical protein [Acidimicrobiales bacterium]HJO99861.1 hypothetical protein [Acidimicrobiales bacterium]|tara:strand:- start:30045 stop:30269 length:225 start_codon:yes stop_codon:yes gene_type:complete